MLQVVGVFPDPQAFVVVPVRARKAISKAPTSVPEGMALSMTILPINQHLKKVP
jgi:hypothetical protein